MFLTDMFALFSVSSEDCRSRRESPIWRDFKEFDRVSNRLEDAGVSFVGERKTSWFSNNGDLFCERDNGTGRLGERSKADCDLR